jgi:hypothetical protein
LRSVVYCEKEKLPSFQSIDEFKMNGEFQDSDGVDLGK